jgi:hypothetical protein
MTNSERIAQATAKRVEANQRRMAAVRAEQSKIKKVTVTDER